MKLLQAEAGVNDGKAGLQSAAGLFSKAGIFDKRSEAFNIKELNPYLLFDTQTSMLGELESPTLDLDPATPSTLDVITATRSGVATYTDADGVIQTAPENTVRVDHVDGVPMMLIEPSATNLVDYSEDFSQPWIPSGVSVLGGQPSPSGSQTATLLKGNTNSSRHNIVRGGLMNTVTASFSLFAKAKELRYLQIASANSTAQVVNVDLLSGTIGNVGLNFSNVVLEPYPDGWFRITLVSPNQYNAFYISLVSSLTAGWLESWAMPNDTDGLYIWGAQLEEGSVATSYIPTSGSTVQRSSDNLVVDGSAFSDFYNATEGTVYVESTGRGYFDFNTIFAFSDNSAVNRIYARSTSNSGGLAVFSGGSVSAAMSGLTVVANNVLSRSAHSFKANNFLTSRDGNSATPDTNGNMPAGIDRLYIGAGDTGGNQLNGHLKRLIYWPTHSDSL